MTIRKTVIYATLLVVAVALWCFTHSDRAKVKRVFADVERLAAKGACDIVRVEGWVDHTGTEVSWPRYEPKAEKFLAHLEKTDGQWLISRIKVP